MDTAPPSCGLTTARPAHEATHIGTRVYFPPSHRTKPYFSRASELDNLLDLARHFVIAASSRNCPDVFEGELPGSGSDRYNTLPQQDRVMQCHCAVHHCRRLRAPDAASTAQLADLRSYRVARPAVDAYASSHASSLEAPAKAGLEVARFAPTSLETSRGSALFAPKRENLKLVEKGEFTA